MLLLIAEKFELASEKTAEASSLAIMSISAGGADIT